jgi:predicted porin
MSDVTTYTGSQKGYIFASTEQINDTILYTGEFDALKVQASFIAASEKNEDGFGLSAKYTLPMGLGFGLAYSEDGKAAYGDDNTKGTSTIAGLNYTVDNLYLGATYATGDTGDRTGSSKDSFEGVELASVYSFDSGFAVKAAYSKSELEEGSEKYNNNDYFELTGDYAFNSNMNAYVAYKFNQLDKDDLDSTKDAEDSIRVGLKYTF